jgi:uncharacterized protein YlxW (UPF0749 family)
MTGLPAPNSVPPLTVMYYGGEISYTDGIEWIPILTAGSFTQVAANGQEEPLTLGTWTGTITDHAAFLTNIQTALSSLTTQVALLQTTVDNMNTEMSTMQQTIMSNVITYLKLIGYLNK